MVLTLFMLAVNGEQNNLTLVLSELYIYIYHPTGYPETKYDLFSNLVDLLGLMGIFLKYLNGY